MPANSGMGFVMVQHLDPSHESIPAEILQRCTAMPVIEAEDGMPVLPDRVHVIPPNRDLVIFNGALQLPLPSEPRGQRLPIDAFLRSLAEDQGDHAVGIILSGTGTDGTLGLRATNGVGGLCLVQEPDSAGHDGVPKSAFAAGHTIRVLRAEHMPQALLDSARRLPRRGAITAPKPQPSAAVERILMLLRTHTGHDFSRYKPNTIGRRLERCMGRHGIDDAERYARYLDGHPEEVQALFRALLINVTSFFRDPQAFAALKADILSPLLASRPPG
jgi:two-component system CheB/CheR fusion protein